MPPSLDPPPPPPPPSISPSPDEKYRTLVIDSNTIIKNAALQLHNKASSFYTTQGVLDEIRDSKARHHLDTLPFEIKIKEPSREACRAIVDFSRKTGDYHCLSSVDLKVLALTYDLEVEGCGNANHLRKEPKRALIGKMTPLGNAPTEESSSDPASASTDAVPQNDIIDAADVDYDDDDDDDDDDSVGDETTTTTATAPPVSRRSSNPSPAVSWASLVNPAATAVTPTPPDRIADTAANQTFGKMSLNNDNNKTTTTTTNDTLAVDLGGQFDDASESSNDVDDDDGMKYAASDADVSDEECDVYILDPHEVEERKRAQAAAAGGPTTTTAVWSTLDEFPTLADAALIPYEGSDDEQQQQQPAAAAGAREAKTHQQQQRRYNSFSKYSHIVTPQGVGNIKQKSSDLKREEEKERLLAAIHEKEAAESTTNTKTTTTNTTNSRIMGGQSLAGQHHDVDDDDTGWITSTTLAKAKITGFSNFSLPTTTTTTKPPPSSSSSSHPPSLRSALITSDYAMQNVALQLSLPLLAPDGTRRITRTKLWVRRCSACFTIYRNNSESRLFCERCGNGNTLERIAASVDGTTGRLRLHLSKKKRRVKLKGSKYSLPKPGKGNRFEGDLLLREDQLMMGAWCQKVKKGNKKSQESLFGSDINDAVGLGDVTKRSDIMVGFGRRNPNASKFGRERRGKKTKGDKRDKACGLRRY